MENQTESLESKQYLGKTRNGIDVYVDKNSHASTHFIDQPKLLEAVKEIIPTIEATDDVIQDNFDLGREVGVTDLLETTDEDEILYAKRPSRQDQYSRFVKNKTSQPTSWVTIDLRNIQDKYELRTAFFGKLTPSFPGGKFMADQSEKFWSTHALVWGSQEILTGTETSEWPW